MSALVRSALEQGVIAAWDRELNRRPVDMDALMARVAINEVLSALRANPAWCRSLEVSP